MDQRYVQPALPDKQVNSHSAVCRYYPILFHVVSWMSHFSCFLFNVLCLMFNVLYFVFHVLCLMFCVSCFIFCVSCFVVMRRLFGWVYFSFKIL